MPMVSTCGETCPQLASPTACKAAFLSTIAPSASACGMATMRSSLCV